VLINLNSPATTWHWCFWRLEYKKYFFKIMYCCREIFPVWHYGKMTLLFRFQQMLFSRC